jgi:recombination protein RecA
MSKEKDTKKVTEEVKENINKKQLELAKKAINKKYGDVVSTLSDHSDIKIPTISTGSLSLDIALGRGGMALGRIYEVFGPNSGGKSTLAANVVAQAQRRGMLCCYIDAEHAVDPVLFRDYGVNLGELEIVQGYDGEGNLDILERYLKTGAFGVAVIDSVSALIPRVEAEANIEDQQMGTHARLMSKALRKITPIANQTGTLLIFINQLRMKIGVYGDPSTTTGGEALGFYSTGRISVRGGEAKTRRIVDDITGEVIGHKTQFEVLKNKLSAPYRKAEIDLIYGRGYDAHRETLSMAVSVGVVEQSGAWYKYGGENFAKGAANASAYLKDESNVDKYKEMRDMVIERVGLKDEYVRHSNPGPLYS